ncbi:MAG: peptidoglycan editing factor PgeF [Sarcina sp.]
MFKKINKDGMEFLQIKDGEVNILFSLAINGISYKLADEVGKKNLEKLKEKFSVDKVNFTNQIHSDLIINLDDQDSREKQADALISSKKCEIVGVFTADCVPVILYDKEKKVISAVHSGWKGTIADISKKVAIQMKERYGCKDIKAIIGPCVGQCCYQVSEELASKFKEKYGENVANDRMLDLKFAIKKQLKDLLKAEDIKDLNICTNCNDEYELHSYRKKMEEAGRLFSFAFIDK